MITNDAEEAIRIMVQQPALPKYRTPVFRNWAARDGVDLLVLYGTVPTLPNVTPDGFRGTHIPLRFFLSGPLKMYWHAAQLSAIDRKNVDVAILSWDVRYISIVPALVKARLLGVPVLLWGHGVSKRKSFLSSVAREAVARLASGVIVYSDSVAATLIKKGWPSQRVFVARNAIDQTAIQLARCHWLRRWNELQCFKQLHALDRTQNIIYVGRIYPARKLELLLDALPAILVERPSVRLILIGAENAYTRRLQRLADRRGVLKRVRWVGEIYDEMDLAPWMLSSHVACFPAHLGLSVQHAMGYGLPVLTSNKLEAHGPEIDALKDGVNGCLFEHGSSSSIATAVLDTLRDETRRQEMAAAARQVALCEYTVNKMVNGFMSAVHAVLNSHNSSDARCLE